MGETCAEPGCDGDMVPVVAGPSAAVDDATPRASKCSECGRLSVSDGWMI